MYDVCVIGSGPGGYVAAIKAAKLGLKVAIIEKENLGGVCLNKGCIPTKALLHCANSYDQIRNSKNLGIEVEIKSFDIEKIVKFSKDAILKLTSGVEMLLKKNKIEIIKGFASFIDKNSISVQQNNQKIEIKAKYFIIATGASPKLIPNVEIDENIICTSFGAMNPKVFPKKIAIIGGGVIGTEFASFYNTFESEVEIFEMSPNIIPTEDNEISQKMSTILQKKGIKIHTNTKVLSIKKDGDIGKIEFQKDDIKKISEFNKIIISIGVAPNTDKINLEKINILIEQNKTIKVNQYCQTNINNIFAIGDIVHGPWLAHKASHEGIIVSEYIAFLEKKINKKPHHINYKNIPSCIYSNPQVASIGFTEDELKKNKIDYKIGSFLSIGNGKAIASQDDNAFVKILTDSKTEEILGAHIIGKYASEMIYGISVSMNSELILDDIINAIFPHPTISEMILEASMDIKNEAIHK